MAQADGKFFIMMYNQKGTHVVPLVDDADEVLLFATRAMAKKTAQESMYAMTFGYNIHEVGKE